LASAFVLGLDFIFVVASYNAISVELGRGGLAVIILGLIAAGITVSVTLVSIYMPLAAFLNRTVVTLENTQLTVRFRPLPWFEEVTVDASQIAFLRTVECNGDEGADWYELHAILKDGKNLKLLHFTDRRKTSYFEEQLNGVLTDGHG